MKCKLDIEVFKMMMLHKSSETGRQFDMYAYENKKLRKPSCSVSKFSNMAVLKAQLFQRTFCAWVSGFPQFTTLQRSTN